MVDKVDVVLEYDGVKYITKLSTEEIEAVSSDSEKYNHLISTLVNEKKSVTDVNSVQDSSDKENTCSEQNIAGPSKRNFEIKWTTETVKLLLDVRLNMEESFIRPSCKKSKLWTRIAEKMKRDGNYEVSPEECNIKYRNLLYTYRLNKQKRLKSTGESKITWEFFNIFDEVLGTKASTVPPQNILSTSLVDVDSEKSEEEISTKRVPADDTEIRPKKKEMSVAKYLFYKREYKEREAQKEEKRWEDKKKLKQEEIKAINNLAEAIKLAAAPKSKRKRDSSESE